jgi:hypothetical protein
MLSGELRKEISTTDVIYKVINDIIPNQPINFELYAKNFRRAMVK